MNYKMQPSAPYISILITKIRPKGVFQHKRECLFTEINFTSTKCINTQPHLINNSHL